MIILIPVACNHLLFQSSKSGCCTKKSKCSKKKSKCSKKKKGNSCNGGTCGCSSCGGNVIPIPILFPMSEFFKWPNKRYELIIINSFLRYELIWFFSWTSRFQIYLNHFYCSYLKTLCNNHSICILYFLIRFFPRGSDVNGQNGNGIGSSNNNGSGNAGSNAVTSSTTTTESTGKFLLSI